MELYIDGQRVPMFGNNSTDIVDTIQNVRDIKKIFTSFSQQFSIPASREVNRIFRHYYDFNIQTGFDARFKIDGAIKIDGVDFRKGKIRLNGTTLKDGSPHSYQIVFFGDTVELSDLLGEDELSALSLNYLNHTYDLTTVRNGLETGLTDNGVTSTDRKIIYPFITHTKQLEITGGNVHEFNNSSSLLGYTDLKPAIKCDEIIKAIETKYGLDFSNDFFSEDVFQNLYLWLHREKGNVTSGNENQTFIMDIEDWIYDVGSAEARPMISKVEGTGLNETKDFYKFKVIINPLTTTGSGIYDVKMTDALTGDVVGEWSNQSGYQTFTSDVLESFQPREWQIRTEIKTEGQVLTFELDAVIERYYQFWQTFLNNPYLAENQYNAYYDSPSSTESMTGEIIISQQVPKIKIIDFLTGIFQMFNLTAYKISDGTIKVQHLDEYYEQGNEYDISEYVDYSQKIKVERVLPFRAIEFKFKDPKTFLSIKRKELTNLEFGNLKYTGGDAFDGKKYTISLPFEKMLFERLQDEDLNVISDVTYGAFLDDKLSPTIGSPLLFLNYPSKSTGSTPIKWTDSVNTTSYNAPSNALANQSQTINFGTEVDETQLIANDFSLFETFYKKYITSLYNIKSRKTTVQAFLPKWLLLQYSLNDVFIINNKKYTINSLKSNPETGKSKIELINKLETFLVVTLPSQSVPQVDGITEGTITANSIEVNWTDVASDRVTSYNVYLDGALSKTINAGVGTHNIVSLASGTEYEIWVNSVTDEGDESKVSLNVNAKRITTL